MGALAQNLKQQIQVMITTRMTAQHDFERGYFHDADILPVIFSSKMNQGDNIFDKMSLQGATTPSILDQVYLFQTSLF